MPYSIDIEVYDNTFNWRSINDYIIQCDEIPLISRNKDYSISAQGFDFEVSQTYPTPLHITSATQVRVKINGGLFFWGNITGVFPINRIESWKIETEHRIMNLRRYTLDNESLHTRLTLAGSPDYIATDYHGFPNTTLINVLVEMWFIAGLGTLYTNNINNEYVVKNKTVVLDDGVTTEIRDFKISDIRVDENMLYRINQSVIRPIDPGSKITFFDFFQFIFSMFGIALNCDSGDWELHSYANTSLDGFSDPTYAIDDTDVLSERERNEREDLSDYYKDTRMTASRLNCSGGFATQLSESFTDLTSSDYSEEPDNMDMYRVIVFLLTAKFAGAIAGQVYKWDASSDWNDNVLRIGDGIFGLRKKQNLTLKYNEVKTLTSLDNAFVSSHYLDVAGVSLDIEGLQSSIIEVEFT